MAGPRTDAEDGLGHLAAAALATLDGADPDPSLDEPADATEAGRRPRPPDPPRVLLIDPDQRTRAALVAALVEGGCQVVAALRTGLTASYALRQHRPTVIVLDLDLRPAGVWGGLALVASLGKEAPGVPVLVLVRPGLEELAERVGRAGARRLLPKPDLDGLVTAVRAEHVTQLQAASPPGGSAAGTPGAGGR